MPLYPNPNGGSMEAANDQQARDMGWNPSMGTFGINTYPNGNGEGGGGGGNTVTASVGGGAAGGLGSAIQSLLGALAAGNQKALDEQIRQFNQTFGLDQSKFQEAIRQFNQNFGENQRQFNVNAGLNAAQLASSQHADPFRQVQTIGQLGRLLNNQGVAGFTSLNGSAADTMGIDYILNQMRAAGAQNTAGTAPGAPSGPAAPAPAGNGSPWAEGTFVELPGVLQGVIQGGKIHVFPSSAAAQAAGVTNPTIITKAQLDQYWTADPPGVNIAAAPATSGTTAAPASNATDTGTATAPGAAPLPSGMTNGLLDTGTGISGTSPLPSGLLGGNPLSNSMTGMAAIQQASGAGLPDYAQQILNQIPQPNQLNAVEFFKSPPALQSMVLSGMRQKFGIEPEDALFQIKNTLPGFTSPGVAGAVKV